MIPDRVKDSSITHLIILLSVTLGIGIYLVTTTVLIAKDGVTYIEYARRLAVSPIDGMRSSRLSPGYPYLIHLFHKLMSMFGGGSSSEGWLKSAQWISLLGRVVSVVALYIVGRLLVGARRSFWGVLILAVLPLPAKYGSDALSDWPHIAFLVIGFWLLIFGARFSKEWMFACAGVVAGLGYLIRPECCQLVIYGVAWLLLNLMRRQNRMRRSRLILALVLLWAGFAVIAVPYMKFRGYVFPEYRLGAFSLQVSMANSTIDRTCVGTEYFAGLLPVGIVEGFGKLVLNLCELLVCYFVPFLVVGLWSWYRKDSKSGTEKFFVTLFFLLNSVILIWVYCSKGYMSKRHSLPLVLLAVFYAGGGLQSVAGRLAVMFSGGGRKRIAETTSFWHFCLFMIGVVICMPKLVRPVRMEKSGYRTAAMWLRENTAKDAVIAVPDQRLIFYGERRGLLYDEKIPERADYVVRVVENDKEEPDLGRAARREYSGWVDEREERGKKLVIYRML